MAQGSIQETGSDQNRSREEGVKRGRSPRLVGAVMHGVGVDSTIATTGKN
jgi:hypothetical protein